MTDNVTRDPYAWTHHDTAILTALDLAPDARVSVDLADGEAAWDPTSTRGLVWGPATLEYRQYPDGGISLSVERP